MNYSLTIPRPPWTALGKELESACRKAIYDFSMFDQSVKKVAIALSGGKDSLLLLFLLAALRGRGFPHFELIAFYVDGEFSCGPGVEEKLLRPVCQELDVPLTVLSSSKKREKLECYSCSRERRSLLFRAAKEAGASVLAFGHHRDDTAQTLLLNLLHKAEFSTNLPKLLMQRYGITIIRPLIYIAEGDIRSFAEQHGFLRISCQCPIGQYSKRKQADQLLKQIEQIFPHARSNLTKAALAYGSQKAAAPLEDV